MTPQELLNAANEAKKQAAYLGMTLNIPRGTRLPKGFPKRKFLSETEGGRVYSLNPDEVIAWLKDSGLVD